MQRTKVEEIKQMGFYEAINDLIGFTEEDLAANRKKRLSPAQLQTYKQGVKDEFYQAVFMAAILAISVPIQPVPIVIQRTLTVMRPIRQAVAIQ